MRLNISHLNVRFRYFSLLRRPAMQGKHSFACSASFKSELVIFFCQIQFRSWSWTWKILFCFYLWIWLIVVRQYDLQSDKLKMRLILWTTISNFLFSKLTSRIQQIRQQIAPANFGSLVLTRGDQYVKNFQFLWKCCFRVYNYF